MTGSDRRWAWLFIALVGLGGVVVNLLYYVQFGTFLTDHGFGGVALYGALGALSGLAYRSERDGSPRAGNR
ncbi:hypothetical protein [Halomicrococcus gelatinilyticus]|uniref:hypothetical protein n=1 Tax=Halomicrococcus gelatinilyticus TaxID=1702103 RepID=UPI002E15FC9B